MKENLEGRLSISRVSGGDDSRRIRITVDDQSSGCRVIEVALTLEDFALALTAMGNTPCTFDLNDSGVVGMKREHKRVEVAVPGRSYDDTKKRKVTIALAVAPLEVEGWEARQSDCENSHNVVRYEDHQTTYRVLFERWVNPVTGHPHTPEKKS